MSSVIVLGAGMVGVASALALQKRGWSVALVDRQEPGRATSYGNAGIIQSEAVEPYAMPRDLPSLLAIATGRTNDVRYSVRHLPAHIGPLLRYWWWSAPDRHARIVAVYSKLIKMAAAAHSPLIEAIAAQRLVRRDGYRVLYRTPSALDAAAIKAEALRSRYGVLYRVLSSRELAAAEPGMKSCGAGGVHWLTPWTVKDPGALVTAYAALFAARGGTVATGDALSLKPAARNGWAIETAHGPMDAKHVVVALGPWSPGFVKRFGLRVPMVAKRGYHRHYTGEPLDLPLLDVENGYMMAPMTRGLRISTGAELTGQDAPSTPRQLEHAENAAQELIQLGPIVEPHPWFGVRPCMPDMLPAIGHLQTHPGIWVNFGHGHQGFTLGPATAELLADLMTDSALPIDMAPLSPERL